MCPGHNAEWFVMGLQWHFKQPLTGTNISVSISDSLHRCFVKNSQLGSCFAHISFQTVSCRLCLRSLRELQDPKMQTSNHRRPRQPDISVKPREARWLRPGQWQESRAFRRPSSRAQEKNKVKLRLCARPEDSIIIFQKKQWTDSGI